MRYKGVIFDFDGTLVDTYPGILHSWKRTFQALGLGRADPEQIKKAIGPTKREYLRLILGDLAPAWGERAVEYYKKDYAEQGPSRTFLFPGVANAVARLKQAGVRLGIASNKNAKQIDLLGERFFFPQTFHPIMAPDIAGAGKPEPDMLLICLQQWHLSPSEVLMVGDMKYDMLAGRAAGTALAAALWGYGSREAVAAFDPDHQVESAGDLPAIVLGASARGDKS